MSRFILSWQSKTLHPPNYQSLVLQISYSIRSNHRDAGTATAVLHTVSCQRDTCVFYSAFIRPQNMSL